MVRVGVNARVRTRIVFIVVGNYRISIDNLHVRLIFDLGKKK